MSTRTQYRAICSVCGREQAVKGDEIVDHGYNLEHHWRNGTCDGARRPHFGTSSGRDYRAAIAARYVEQAHKTDLMATAIEKGEAIARSYDKKLKQMVDLTAPWAIRQRVESLRSDAASMRSVAGTMMRSVESWKEAFPREVQVEKAAGPMIHFHRERWGKFCAGSAMGAMRGHTSTDWAHVNCPKCLARKAYFDAQKARQAMK